MPSDFLPKAESLRQEAWHAMLASQEYAIFKAMDAAVVASGGSSLMPVPHNQSIADGVRLAASRSMFALRTPSAAAVGYANGIPSRRVSQGDAAERALRRSEAPQQVSDLLLAATAEGANIGGEKPMVNFTSTLSKDARFYSFRKNGTYYWWLRGVALPPKWNETEPDDFDGLLGSASSVSSGQEGGDGDAPATN